MMARSLLAAALLAVGCAAFQVGPVFAPPASRRGVAVGASRVAVCGPSGGTVADAVAFRLAASEDYEVVRVSEAGGGVGRVDAAVCCGDGAEDAVLSKLLDACGAPPRTVVVVGPGGGEDGEASGGGGLGALLGGLGLGEAPGSNDPSEVAGRALGGGASSACVVLHGPLFGSSALGSELKAFKTGLLKEPVLEDDFGRRGARVAVVKERASGEDQMFSSGTWLGLGDMAAASERGQMREAKTVAASKPLAATRRGAVADAVVAALASPELRPGLFRFEVRSAAGDVAPTGDEWAALLAEVLRAGAKSTTALRTKLQVDRTWDPEALGDWLRTEWGPTALRSVDATLAIRGARPVAFEAPPRGTDTGALGALRWETLTDDGIVTEGRLDFVVQDGNLVATRDRVNELTGEADLMDLLVDALSKYALDRAPPAPAAAVEVVEEAAAPEAEDVAAQAPPPPAVAAAAEENPYYAPPEEAEKTVTAPAKKRRSAVRTRTQKKADK